MTKYSVKQVAKLAGVSVRTLHHYDKIGLLKPSERAESKYRYYYRNDLLKLQQILFYKELGFQLNQILDILTEDDFDLMKALEYQRKELLKKADGLKQLIQTLDKTIVELKTGKEMKEEELYTGFPKEEIQTIRNEVKQKWGEDELLTTEARLKKLNKTEWATIMQQGEDVGKDLSKILHLEASDARVQQIVKNHYHWVCNCYEVSKERYLGLSKLYVTDERFKEFYDKYGDGTANHLSNGIVHFATEYL
jgi:DNA-binding transcriptional MerR regulator